MGGWWMGGWVDGWWFVVGTCIFNTITNINIGSGVVFHVDNFQADPF